ncbi:MAG: hypothetical protein GVY18_18985 [Bacteroidetes bacterium]|jgi:hypothetical protein|nr:hypothetical protein [Bacteroidota bacterium]
MEARRLFARLYLDEDVDVLVAHLVRSRGFEVATTHSERMLGQSDASQLAYASEHAWALVTHNRTDFEALAVQYFEEGRMHWGIICAFRRPPHDLADRLVRLLNEHTAADLKNQVVYL